MSKHVQDSQKRSLSRGQTAVVTVVGWALLSLASSSPRVEPAAIAEPAAPVAAIAPADADPSAIARVLDSAGGTLSVPERERIARAVVRYSAKYELDPELVTVESNVEAGCLILADNIRRMGEADGILAYFWGPNIRGDAYLGRVRAAQAEVRRILRSS